MNIIEKSLAKHANLDKVIPKDRVTLEPSFLFISGKTAVNVIKEFYELGYQKVIYPSRTVFICEPDCASNRWAEIKKFCKVNGLDLIDKVESIADFLTDKQNTLNELAVAGLGSQIGILGVHGAIPQIISPVAMARCLGTGKIEMVIPETVYIEINGILKQGATAENICDYLQEYFKDSLIGCGVVIGGTTVEQLDENGKGRIAKFFLDTGGVLAIISPAGPLGQVESVVKIKAHNIPKHTSFPLNK